MGVAVRPRRSHVRPLTPEVGPMLFYSTLPQGFWDKVWATPWGCWLWTGAASWLDYGVYGAQGKRNTRVAHRLAYQDIVGAIPSGLTLDHLCRLRRCVNPRHLEPVTLKENILRGDSPCAKNKRKVKCSKCGGALVATTYDGRRWWPCRRAYIRRYKREWART